MIRSEEDVVEKNLELQMERSMLHQVIATQGCIHLFLDVILFTHKGVFIAGLLRNNMKVDRNLLFFHRFSSSAFTSFKKILNEYDDHMLVLSLSTDKNCK